MKDVVPGSLATIGYPDKCVYAPDGPFIGYLHPSERVMVLAVPRAVDFTSTRMALVLWRGRLAIRVLQYLIDVGDDT